jgi:hypothetical protein
MGEKKKQPMSVGVWYHSIITTTGDQQEDNHHTQLKKKNYNKKFKKKIKNKKNCDILFSSQSQVKFYSFTRWDHRNTKNQSQTKTQTNSQMSVGSERGGR